MQTDEGILSLTVKTQKCIYYALRQIRVLFASLHNVSVSEYIGHECLSISYANSNQRNW